MLRTSVALVTLVCATVAGCGAPDCEELCEDETECPQSRTEDCAAECRALTDLANTSGCKAKLDSFIACLGDVEDICNGEECAGLGGELLDCEIAYCLEHSGDPACASASGCPVRSANTCHESGACTTTNAEGEVVVLPDCVVGQTCDDGSYSLTCEVLGGECTCAKGGEALASVAYQEAFCEPIELDIRVAAARTACGWP